MICMCVTPTIKRLEGGEIGCRMVICIFHCNDRNILAYILSKACRESNGDFLYFGAIFVAKPRAGT